MQILEALKRTFLKDSPIDNHKLSNDTSEPRVIKTLSDSDYEGAMVFGNLNGYSEFNYGGDEGTSLISYQNKIIDLYRNLAKNPDVNNIIDMITNEMVFTVDKNEFSINIDEENDSIRNKINEIFEKVQALLNTSDNLHAICRQTYIDGQLNVVLGYEKNAKNGIQRAEIIEPRNLYFDLDNKVWKYNNQDLEHSLYNIDLFDYDEEYTQDELVHVDFGLFSKVSVGAAQRGQVNLGYLENAFKASNQLSTLENMLIPLRYSRSVSRRLFNVDVAELPPKKAKELLDKIRSEFKYKKTYDTEKGLIKNMQSTQPLVEDYWMSNRNGMRGTTVDTMDEKGGLMDMEDIIYASKKLYSSLKVPTSRNPYADNDGGDFSFDTDSVTNEDLQYFLHVERLRIPIIKLYKEILKREVISTGIMTEKEWNNYKNKIQIKFTSKSIFLENMEKDLLMKSMGNWQDMKEEVGTIISFEDGVHKVFGWSNTELEEQMKKIKNEANNPLYKAFYGSKESDGF